MIYDDGISGKSHDEMLDKPDLEYDVTEICKGSDWENPPDENYEPGQIRYQSFSQKCTVIIPVKSDKML